MLVPLKTRHTSNHHYAPALIATYSLAQYHTKLSDTLLHDDIQRLSFSMAPSKPRAGQDDSRSEASSTKEKTGHAGSSSVTKGRRGGGANASSSLRDVTNASTTAVGTAGTVTASQEPVGVRSATSRGILLCRRLTTRRCNGTHWTMKSCTHIEMPTASRHHLPTAASITNSSSPARASAVSRRPWLERGTRDGRARISLPMQSESTLMGKGS